MPFTKLVFDPPIIAHRGASLFAPENTLAAFRRAKELGINWIEFDVMLSRDDVPVVIHDDSLDRTTNGRGLVGDFMYDYLQTLDAGSWFDPQFASEKIPTLREVISLINELNLNANIEIKAQTGKEEITVKKVLKMIADDWKNSDMPPLISSFSTAVLEMVRKHSADALLGFLVEEWNDQWQLICDDLHCSAVDLNYKILTREKISLIKSTGRSVLTYTVNDPTRAQSLLALGVDAIFSDCPPKMVSFLL